MGALTEGPFFLGVNLEGWLLGGLVFIWTPSHTWAMATKNLDDYTNTDIPMLPVVIGIEKTAFYTLIAGAVTAIYGTWLSWEISGRGLVILALSIPNFYFLRGLWSFYKEPSVQTGAYAFKVHNIWLTFIFGTILLFIVST
jgi:protoheme IX farnesyltransferase